MFPNAASTTLTFLVTLFVICPALLAFGLHLNNKEKRRLKREDQSLFLNGMCGKLEYLSSWYFFWDEIVPEVYRVHNARGGRSISVYSQEFTDIGYELYQCEPAVEALRRSMEYMKSIGRPHYVSYEENERWFHHYRRPDLTYRPFKVTKIAYGEEFPTIEEPGENDARRRQCICSDGITAVPLREIYTRQE